MIPKASTVCFNNVDPCCSYQVTSLLHDAWLTTGFYRPLCYNSRAHCPLLQCPHTTSAILPGAHSYFVVSLFKYERKNSCHDLVPNPRIICCMITKNQTAVSIHHELTSVYEEGCMSIQVIWCWCAWCTMQQKVHHSNSKWYYCCNSLYLKEDWCITVWHLNVATLYDWIEVLLQYKDSDRPYFFPQSLCSMGLTHAEWYLQEIMDYARNSLEMHQREKEWFFNCLVMKPGSIIYSWDKLSENDLEENWRKCPKKGKGYTIITI